MTGFEVNRDISREDGNIDFMYTLKGTAFAFVISIVLLFLCAVLMTYSPIPDNAAKAVTVIVSAISIFISGFMVSKKSKRQGWLSGAIAGLTYTILMYLFGSLVMLDFSVKLSTVLIGVMAFIIGAVGGIVGINTSHKRRR